MHRFIVSAIISLLASTSFAGEPAKETKTTNQACSTPLLLKVLDLLQGAPTR